MGRGPEARGPQELHEQEIGVGETDQFDIDQEIRVSGCKLGDADAPAGWRFNAEISEDAVEQGDVRSRAAVQEVVAAAAAQDIWPRRHRGYPHILSQKLVAAAASHRVVAGSAEQLIVAAQAGITLQDISGERVVAVAAEQDVVTAGDLSARSGEERCDDSVARENIVAAAAEERIVTTAVRDSKREQVGVTDNGVVTLTAIEVVVAA